MFDGLKSLFSNLFGASEETAKKSREMKEVDKGKKDSWFSRKVNQGLDIANTINTFGSAAGYVGGVAQFLGAGRRRAGTSQFAMQAAVMRRSDGGNVPSSNSLFDLGKASSSNFNKNVAELNVKNEQNNARFEQMAQQHLKRFNSQASPQFTLGDAHLYSKNLENLNRNHVSELQQAMKTRNMYKMAPISTSLNIPQSFDNDDSKTKSIKGYVHSSQTASASAILAALDTVNRNVGQAEQQRLQSINDALLQSSIAQSNFSTNSLKEIQSNIVDLQNTEARASADNHKMVYEGISNQIHGVSDVEISNLELIRKQQENMHRSAINIAMEQNKMQAEYRLEEQRINGKSTLASIEAAVGRLTQFVQSSVKTTDQIEAAFGEAGRQTAESFGAKIGQLAVTVVQSGILLSRGLQSVVGFVGEMYNGVADKIPILPKIDYMKTQDMIGDWGEKIVDFAATTLGLDRTLFISSLNSADIASFNSAHQLGKVFETHTTGGESLPFTGFSADMDLQQKSIAIAQRTHGNEGTVMNANDNGLMSTRGVRVPNPGEWNGVKRDVILENIEEVSRKNSRVSTWWNGVKSNTKYHSNGKFNKNHPEFQKYMSSLSTDMSALLNNNNIAFGPSQRDDVEMLVKSRTDPSLYALFLAMDDISPNDFQRVYDVIFYEAISTTRLEKQIALLKPVPSPEIKDAIISAYRSLQNDYNLLTCLVDFFYVGGTSVKNKMNYWFAKIISDYAIKTSITDLYSRFTDYNFMAKVLYSSIISGLYNGLGQQDINEYMDIWKARFKGELKRDDFFISDSVDYKVLDGKNIQDFIDDEKSKNKQSEKIKTMWTNMSVDAKTDAKTFYSKFEQYIVDPVDRSIVYRAMRGDPSLTEVDYTQAQTVLEKFSSLYSDELGYDLLETHNKGFLEKLWEDTSGAVVTGAGVVKNAVSDLIGPKGPQLTTEEKKLIKQRNKQLKNVAHDNNFVLQKIERERLKFVLENTPGSSLATDWADDGYKNGSNIKYSWSELPKSLSVYKELANYVNQAAPGISEDMTQYSKKEIDALILKLDSDRDSILTEADKNTLTILKNQQLTGEQLGTLTTLFSGALSEILKQQYNIELQMLDKSKDESTAADSLG